MTSVRKNYERLTARRRAVSLSGQRILEMMRMAFGVRRSKVADIGGTLRKGSVSFGGLIVEIAEKLGSGEPIGASA